MKLFNYSVIRKVLYRTLIVFSAVIFFHTESVKAQLSLNNTATTYTDDLNALPSSGSPTWTNNVTLLKIELSRGEGLPRLLTGDPVRLAQILSNLVSNAVKFTQRGRIEIRAEVAQRTGARLTLSLQVRDTGIGMDAGQIARIFQPFTQGDVSTTRRFGGTGLGLTLCKRLADLMGGQMEVASRVGEGSSFTVHLPFQAVDAPTTPRPAPAESAAPDEKFSGRRALLVEDNAINRLVASVMLERIGLRVDVAADGREAVDKIDAAPGHYDVIFMDVQMPNLDGMETTRLIRRQHPSLKLPIKKTMESFWLEDNATQKVMDGFSENTVSNYILPYGLAPNLLVDGTTYCVPMVIEESSVVAADLLGSKILV